MLEELSTESVSYPLGGASRAIVRDLLLHGPRSRAELAERLRLSPGSLTRLTKPLLDAGLVKEGVAVVSGQGRPSTPLEVVASSGHFIGVKLTGDEAYAVLIDLHAQMLAEKSVRLERRSPEAVCDLVTELAAELSDGRLIASMGVTFGGHSPDHATAFAPYLGWNDVPLAAMLTRATGLVCVLDNDVVAFAESQHWFGAGRAHDRFALITIGAGIGYALVLHDRILRSQEVDIGVFGHYIIDRAGPYCPSGHRGCAAAYLTSDAVAATASVALRRPVSHDEVWTLAERGDPVCRRIADESGLALGRLLGAVADMSMTTNIILSGEGVRLAAVAAEALWTGISECRPDWASPVALEVQESTFFEWARGAGVMAMQISVVGTD